MNLEDRVLVLLQMLRADPSEANVDLVTRAFLEWGDAEAERLSLGLPTKANEAATWAYYLGKGIGPTIFSFSTDTPYHRVYHWTGEIQCVSGACEHPNFPRRCGCGGLVHANYEKPDRRVVVTHCDRCHRSSNVVLLEGR